MSDAPALLVCTTYRLRPDSAEAFRALALRMQAASKASDGCAFLDVTKEVDDPAVFRLIEGWRDQAALDAHSASDEFKVQLKDASELAIIDRSIDVYSVKQKKAVPAPS